MSEKGTIERAKERQGILSKIQNFFTLGYSTKEDVRELDKQLRDYYYGDMREMRHRWEKAYLEVLEKGPATLSRVFKSAIQTLDRVSEQVNRADYGYAGLRDRKGHIREAELTSAFDFDRAFGEELDQMNETVEKVYSDVMAGAWNSVSVGVEAFNDRLHKVEIKWKDREKQFRPPMA